MSLARIAVLRLAAVVLAGVAAQSALACYTVYDAGERVVYQSERPPVDMSRPLHETLPARFPGGQLVFDETASCSVISSLASGRGARNMTTTSPLLTDESTARAMGLRHESLGRGIALVAPGDARMAPGVMTIPSEATLMAGRPDTRVLGNRAR